MQAADTISAPTVPTANLAERIIIAKKYDEGMMRMSLPRMCRNQGAAGDLLRRRVPLACLRVPVRHRNDLLELVGLLADPRGVVCRRTWSDGGAGGFDAATDFWILKRSNEIAMPAGQHGLRKSGGAHKAIPGHKLKIRNALLNEGWHVGRIGQPRARCDTHLIDESL